MEFFGLLAILAFFTILIGSVMGFVANSRVSSLELELKRLKLQLQKEKSAKATRDEPIPTVEDLKASLLAERERDPVVTPEMPETVPTTDEKPETKLATQKIPRPPKTKKVRRSFEEELGARWAVWVGGLALFLGAVFLLRYTIEAGFFTPIMRVALTCLFGAGLLGVGEFLRRADQDGKKVKLMDTDFAKSLSESADIPGVLTAVGIFALLGAAYASHALYGLIGPIPAFVLMGLLSLAALALGLLHGPKLAALGLVASLATPQLVQSDPPNAYNLFIYLIIVGTAALALARKRSWGWLNVFTLFGLLGWSFLSMAATKSIGTHYAWLGFLASTFAAGVFVSSSSPNPEKKIEFSTLEFGPWMNVIWGALAAFIFWLVAIEAGFERPHYIAGLIGVGVLMATTWFRPRQSLHVITAGILAMVLILGGLGPYSWKECLITGIGVFAVYIWMCHTRLHANTGLLPQQLRRKFWPAAAIFLPVAFFYVFYVVDSDMGPNIAGLILLGLSAAYAAQSYINRPPTEESGDLFSPSSIYALGAGLTYVLAVAIAFTGMTETLGLILGIGLAVASARRVPIKTMGMIAAGFALLTAANALFLRVPEAGAVSDRLVFNGLWAYFALPAAVCAISAWELGKSRKDLWTEGLKAMALVFAALFAVFQIRHAMNNGQLLSGGFTLEEMSMQVLVGLCFTLGGSLIGRQSIDTKAPAHENFIPTIAMGVSLLTLALFALGVCLSKAPLFNANVPIKGGFVLNTLLLAYLLPAILLAAIAWFSRQNRPKPYVQLVAGLSLVSIIHYLTGMIRHAFSGDSISIFRKFPDNAELYSISAAWLALGIALLVLGIRSKRQDIRMASAIVIVLTVFKAFFVDMASLEGVLRALSFVVLGVVLIVIGRVYQRLLFSNRAAQSAEP